MSHKAKCGAHARSTGAGCKAPAMANGRCRRHGGLSSGPKTLAGRQAVSAATRKRMVGGQCEQALAGFFVWLEAGGRGYLTRTAQARESRRRNSSRTAELEGAAHLVPKKRFS